MTGWQAIPLWDDDVFGDLPAPVAETAVAVVVEESVAVPLLPAPGGLIGVFDLETTGVDVREDRIVTAHVGVLDATRRCPMPRR